VVGALDREWIIQIAFGILELEIRSDCSRGPTGRRVVIHSCHAGIVSPRQTQDLRRRGSRAVDCIIAVKAATKSSTN